MVRKPKRNVQEFRGRRTEGKSPKLAFLSRSLLVRTAKQTIDSRICGASLYPYTDARPAEEDATQHQHDGQHQNTLQ